eukprot:TRINITY_DN16198_c0_g1_i2.p1 TRINITY_DN16198_c0_g1~~TRINITY_DN16198_c0_g1_i2.p1  ORF type:complete len:117 (+),score=8.82 TRINITY_DN16198_c0_g1_i2:242-592(+)
MVFLAVSELGYLCTQILKVGLNNQTPPPILDKFDWLSLFLFVGGVVLFVLFFLLIIPLSFFPRSATLSVQSLQPSLLTVSATISGLIIFFFFSVNVGCKCVCMVVIYLFLYGLCIL